MFVSLTQAQSQTRFNPLLSGRLPQIDRSSVIVPSFNPLLSGRLPQSASHRQPRPSKSGFQSPLVGATSSEVSVAGYFVCGHLKFQSPLVGATSSERGSSMSAANTTTTLQSPLVGATSSDIACRADRRQRTRFNPLLSGRLPQNTLIRMVRNIRRNVSIPSCRGDFLRGRHQLLPLQPLHRFNPLLSGRLPQKRTFQAVLENCWEFQSPLVGATSSERSIFQVKKPAREVSIPSCRGDFLRGCSSSF